jgi:hypothetical protein
MAPVDSFSIQDWVAIASLAVAIAVPLSGGIVTWLRHRDRSADRIQIEAQDHGDGVWTARLSVTGLPSFTSHEASLKVLTPGAQFFDDVSAPWRDIGGPSFMMMRQGFGRRHLKLEGNAVRTKLIKSDKADELMAPLGLSVPTADACRICIDIHAKGRVRRVARRTVSVAPVE